MNGITPIGMKMPVSMSLRAVQRRSNLPAYNQEYPHCPVEPRNDIMVARRLFMEHRGNRTPL